MSQPIQRSSRSVYEEARQEAERHKWIESQKQGRDLGEAALRDWYRRYWNAYCRFRHLEHLHGDHAWEEFSPQIFGELVALMKRRDPLFEEILRRVCDGQENLEIIQWALDSNQNMDRIRSILATVDVNRARLAVA